MADRSAHPGDDQRVELALGTLPQDDEAVAIRHLAGCTSCRVQYDELSATLDAVLSASPAVAPPAGFEARVLDGLPDDAASGTPRRPPPHRRPRLPTALVAAAAALALLLGGVAGVLLDRALTSSGSSSGTGSDDGWTALETSAGDSVGSVAASRYRDRAIVVIHVADGPPGMRYRCRLVAADGSRHDSGEWTVPDSGRAVWIATLPDAGAVRVELVTDDGRVWSSAGIAD